MIKSLNIKQTKQLVFNSNEIIIRKTGRIFLRILRHPSTYTMVKYRISHHSDETSDKLEVMQMIRIDMGCRVDLQTVIVLIGVLEQAIHGIQYFMGQQQEPFPFKITNLR